MTSIGKNWVRRTGGVATLISGCGLALLLAVTLTGCDGESDAPSGYDPNLRYPLRQDAIVLQTPSTNPTGPAPLGQLDESITAFASSPVGKILDPKSLRVDQREQLKQTLDTLFGTPAAPNRVPGLDYTAEQLAFGSQVYRKQCVQCHGLEGHGRGLTGLTIYPHPRDFRQGLFKTALNSSKPTIGMMKRVIRRGTAAMQPYDLLPEAEVDAVIGYVIHLSIRGEVEFDAMKQMLDDSSESDWTATCHEQVLKLSRQWATARDVPPVSNLQMDWTDASYQDSVRRGYEQFTGIQAASCISCHADYGRTERYQYDAWGTVVRVPDLTKGEFRWARDPASLNAVIRHGIPASRMPGNPLLAEHQLLDLANFVREVSQPARLPADVRDQVYRSK